MSAPSHADAMLFMEYYKLWATPLDGEAWTLFRTLHSEGALEDFERFLERVPSNSHEYVLFDRVCSSFEQAGVLMKNGLMHPNLYFDAWVSPTLAWERAGSAVEGLRKRSGEEDLYTNFEWLARREEQWLAAREDAA